MAPEVDGKLLFAIGHCSKAGPGLRGKPQGAVQAPVSLGPCKSECVC